MDTSAVVENVQDRRALPRSRVLFAGKIVYGNFAILVDCTIRDVSESGARVFVPSDSSCIPAEMHLLDIGKKTITPARIAWHRGGLLGLEFLGRSQFIDQSLNPLVRRLRLLGSA